MATFIPIGEPAHDGERQAIKHLVDGLPDEYTVYGNPWLVDRGGSIYELDAVVVAPHAIYVVEIKSYRGVIQGNDHDWYVPAPIRSPLKLNRKTAQVLASHLKQRSSDAARPFVEGFVFLSQASDCRVAGPASAERVHTRKTILQAIQDRAAIVRREGQRPPVDEHAARVLDELLTGVDRSQPPPRRIREWRLEATLDHTDRYTEHFATHALTGDAAVLRVYETPPLADEAERHRVEERIRWEAQVLRRIGQHPHIIHADAPFTDESRHVLPFEPFQGITLSSWIERFGPKLAGSAGVQARVDLWKTIARALEHAHRQGVVHRVLRPEVILVEEREDAPDLRVGGFELAKQLWLPGRTLVISSLPDDRLRWAAPEVLRAFSDADARSDQFSLGALLGTILTGRPLFDSTEELVRRGGTFTRLRDINPSFKLALDKVVAALLEVAAAKRFKSLDEAIAAVDDAIAARAPATAPAAPALNPEKLAAGTRLGTEYEILGPLGAGGLATVYLARHLPSGTTRALKVARPDPRAEAALEAEYRALADIDHPNIVRRIDLTHLVPERRTLVLERVRGVPLAERLRSGPLSDEERRQYAENLLAALGYLETRGIVHKDLKPDNLIVGPDGLTLIDFSLAGEPPEATLAGTALYRDPALDRWSHAADRYAAALCLFELYVGRHPFDGQAPPPDEAPRLDLQELDRAALVEFFRKALHPTPALRYPSAVAMRAALLQALGSRSTSSTPPGPLESAARGSQAPLWGIGLSDAALRCLQRAGITTQGALVALSEPQIRDLQGLGHRRRDEVLTVRASLLAAGVPPAPALAAERRHIFPLLVGDGGDVQRLGLSPGLTEDLARAGFTTIGRVAEAAREDLQALPGVGPGRIAQIVQALRRFADAASATDRPTTLDGLWDLAAAPLQGQQKPILERLHGIRGARVTQIELADALGQQQPAISLQKQRALGVLDRRILDEVIDHAEALLVRAGGVLRIDEAARRLLERWPVDDPCDFDSTGVLRLLAELEPARLACRDILDDEPSEVLARPMFSGRALRAFVEAAHTLAKWPPKAQDGVRRSLQAYLPEYPFDPVGLATQLDRDLRLTEDGELYQAPVQLTSALPYVLRKARLPIPLEALRQMVESSFGEAVAPAPEPHELVKLLAQDVGCRYDPEDGMVHPAGGRSIELRPAQGDALPPELLVKDPAEVVGDILRSVAPRRGFRLVIAPPERHPEIARSVARALGPQATYVSFEDAFFRRAEPQIDALERAARFAAQRPRLRREAEALLDALLEQHGRPGAVVVLGETALFGVCDALHLVRRLYDQTATGGRGFWALVIPGVIAQRQPVFNERPGATVFSIEGAVLPLTKEIPAS